MILLSQKALDNTNSLQSCPFCGGDVELFTSMDHLCDNGYHEIVCDICDIGMREGFILSQYIAENKNYSEDKTKKRLIWRWNKRQ